MSAVILPNGANIIYPFYLLHLSERIYMFHRRSSFITISLFLILLMLAACQAVAVPSASPGQSAESQSPAAEPFRIALILPSSATDISWSQSIYDGLKGLQVEMGEDALQLALSENMFQVTDAAAAIRDYASEGYDLIIAHGAQYGNPLFEVAADFPETSFAWGTTTNTGADLGLGNVFAYEPAAHQGGYVNGVLAAMLTESNIIGVIGPVEAGDAKLYIDGFKKGVMDTNPAIVVNVSYTGSFGDTALAAEAANVHIQAGADVLTGSAQQVVGSIGVAKEHGVYWMGSQSDQSLLAPEYVVANQIYEWTTVLTDMIESHKRGEWGNKVYSLDYANGGQNMLFNDSVEISAAKVAELKTAAEEVLAGIKTGEIKTIAD
jgi:basic membrane protein A and related proteins